MLPWDGVDWLGDGEGAADADGGDGVTSSLPGETGGLVAVEEVVAAEPAAAEGGACVVFKLFRYACHCSSCLLPRCLIIHEVLRKFRFLPRFRT